MYQKRNKKDWPLYTGDSPKAEIIRSPFTNHFFKYLINYPSPVESISTTYPMS